MFSLFLRRTHMYLALFLSPWVLMYALSTIAMNHRHALNPDGMQGWEKVGTRRLQAAVEPGAPPKVVGEAVLAAVGETGRFNARRDGERIVVQRHNLLTPLRYSFTPATGEVLIEKQSFRWPGFLERFHRRRGYEEAPALDIVWAVSVDAFVVTVVFWALSGIWLWWGLRPTRLWGTASFVLGCALFTFFLLAI